MTLVALIGIAAIVMGIELRFSGLATRTFWEDEAFSALRISGHSYVEVTALFDGRCIGAAQVARCKRTPRPTCGDRLGPR